MSLDLEDLPDVVLVRIFSYLSLEEKVFILPKLNRRLRNLVPLLLLSEDRLHIGHRPSLRAIEAAFCLVGPLLRHVTIGNRAGDLREVLDMIAAKCPHLIRLEFNVWRPLGREVLEKVGKECSELKYLDVQYQAPERLGVHDPTFQALVSFSELNYLRIRGNGRSLDAVLAAAVRSNRRLQYIDVLHEVTLTNDVVTTITTYLRPVLTGFHFHCPHLNRVTVNEILACVGLVSLTIASRYEVFGDLLEPRIRDLKRLRELRLLEPSSPLSIARSSFGRAIVADLLWNGTFREVTHLTISSSLLKDENMLLIFGSCRGVVHCDLENPKHALELSPATFGKLAENSGKSMRFLSFQAVSGNYEPWSQKLTRQNFPELKCIFLVVTDGVSIDTWQSVEKAMRPIKMVVHEGTALALVSRVTNLYQPFTYTVVALTPIFRSPAVDQHTDAAIWDLHNLPASVHRIPELKASLASALM